MDKLALPPLPAINSSFLQEKIPIQHIKNKKYLNIILFDL